MTVPPVRSMRHPPPGLLCLLTLGCAANAASVLPPRHNPIGTSDPTLLLGAARDGSWVAICQARADTNHDGRIAFHFGLHGDVYGDALSAYLVLGAGPGKPIDRFLGNDPSGRWVAYARGQRRWLLDTITGSEVALDSSPALVPPPLLRPQFDSTGATLLYLTGDESHPKAVLRRLSDGHESDLDSGPGILWRATFSPDGKHVVMRVVDQDTNGDGRLRAPVNYTDRSSNPCGVAAVSLSTTNATDEPSWRVARVSDGVACDVRNFEGTFGDAILRRTDSGSLVSEDGDSTRELLPASCGVHVLKADGRDDTVVVACTREMNGLEVLHGGRRVRTGCRLKDKERISSASITYVTCADAPPKAEAGFLSFDKHQLVFIMASGQSFERPLVSEAGSGWHRHDLSDPPDIHAPRVELCSTYPVLDLTTGEVDQPNHRRVTLGTTGGLVLESTGTMREGLDTLAIGPLFWGPPTYPGVHCPSWKEMSRK
jgi:hypothetical protein